MVTSHDIDKALFRSFKAQFVKPSVPLVGHTYIGGMVYNGDRLLNSTAEDITVRTLSLSGDGFPQDALVNVNVYVPDIVEHGGGYVRDGARLAVLSKAVTDFIETLEYPNAELAVEAVTEIAVEPIHQHYLNFRLRLTVYHYMTSN